MNSIILSGEFVASKVVDPHRFIITSPITQQRYAGYLMVEARPQLPCIFLCFAFGCTPEVLVVTLFAGTD